MGIKYRKVSLTICIIVFILTSCAGGQTSVLPTPIVTTSLAATGTPSPTFIPTITFTPTTTPTPRVPVLPGTQMPVSDRAISVDNLDQVVELARWGKGVITDAVYSQDGELIAVGTTIGISLYKADTLDELLFVETGASVNSFAFSPDGESFAAGLNDNTVKLWNVSDGTLLLSIDGHVDENIKKDAEKPEVTSVAFSPDSSQIVGGFIDGVVHVWEVLDGSLLLTLNNHDEKVTGVFFSPDGETLFSASRDGKVHMINAADGRLLHTFLGVSIIDASLSNDGKTLATYDTYYYYNSGVRDVEEKLTLWDVESGKKLESILDQGFVWNNTTDLAFSPNGEFIGAALEDRSVTIWDVASGELINTLDDLKPTGPYYLDDFNLSISPDSNFLLLAGSGEIGVWDLNKSTLLIREIIKSQEINDIALSSNRNVLAAAEGPNINLWEFPEGNLYLSQDILHSRGSLDFSPDGTSLLLSTFDYEAQIFSLIDGDVEKSFEPVSLTYIGGVAFSPDGKTLAIGTRNTGEVELRQISDGSLLTTMFLDTYAFVISVRFSSDGKYLAASTWDRIRLFELPSGNLLQTFNRGPYIAFSPDGTQLAGSYIDKTITIWGVPNGDVLFTIRDVITEPWSIMFSPDGEFLIAGYADGTIEIFLASDGTLLKSWKGHTRGVTDLVFSPDGKLLISSSYDGTVRMWGIKP